MHVAIFMSWFLFGFLHHLVDVAGEECNDNYFNLHTIICLFFFPLVLLVPKYFNVEKITV